MPQIMITDVKLAFTQNMTRESEYGGYNFSFIINKERFCEIVRKTLEIQKTKIWPDSKNTDDFICEKCNAKQKNKVTHEATREMMSDDDVLVQVKSKEAAIENSKRVPLGRGTIADIVIDVFEYAYGKRQFICVRSHAERGCTVKVKNLVEFSNGPKYFDYEDSDAGIAIDALNDVVEENVF